MAQFQIAILVGSLRKESFNLRLSHALIKLAPSEFIFKHLPIHNLPFYNQDDDDNPAETVKILKADILASQGVIFVTPEYNRSVPGVLKNAIDHASRPYGQSAFDKIPAGVLGISSGAIGTAVAQQHLRNVLAYLNMPTLNSPEVYLQMKDDFFEKDGSFNEKSKKFMQKWMDNYVAWVKKHN